LWVACGVLGGMTMFGYLLLDKIHHSPATTLAEPAAAD
jgi:hypothetical protein